MQKAFLKGIGPGKIRESDYILGPLYKTKKGRPKDLQIGVTGGIAVQEPNWVAASRELGEEIGLVPKSKSDLYKLHKGTYKTRWGYKEMQVYDLYIRDTAPVRDHQHGVKVTSREDHPSLKVGCLVYGSRKQVFDFLSRENIYIYYSEDTIMGLGAIKASDILKLIQSGEFKK